MDESEWFGGYSTSATRDGVTVEKGITLDAIPLPAIRLRLTSNADQPVAVRVVERVPATMPMENVAFHVDHDAAHWRATEDNRLVWRRRVDPGETVETLFGVWLTETRQVYAFLKDPEIAAVRRLDGRGDATSWRYEGEETNAVDVIDDEFETAEPALLRTMIADLREALTGERDETDTTLGPATRAGRRTLDAPTADGVAELHDSVGDVPAEDRHVVRVATEGGRHGGGGVAVLQELTNAVDVLAKRVRPQSGDGEVLDALLVADHDDVALADSLAERPQVTGALVAPVGAAAAEDEGGATDADAGVTEDDAPVENPDDEVPDDPMAEFTRLQDEIDQVSTGELERELEDVTLPGAEDREDEIGIDELLDEVGPMEDGDGDLETDADADPATDTDADPESDAPDDEGTGDVFVDDLLAEMGASGADADAASGDAGTDADGTVVDPPEAATLDVDANGDAEEWEFGLAGDDGTGTTDGAGTADTAASASDADPETAADGAIDAGVPDDSAETAGLDPETAEYLVDELTRLRDRVAELEDQSEEIERLRARVAELESQADELERLRTRLAELEGEVELSKHLPGGSPLPEES